MRENDRATNEHRSVLAHLSAGFRYRQGELSDQVGSGRVIEDKTGYDDVVGAIHSPLALRWLEVRLRQPRASFQRAVEIEQTLAPMIAVLEPVFRLRG